MDQPYQMSPEGTPSTTAPHIQILNIKKYAELDRLLWKAFTEIEKREPIPFFSWLRGWSTFRRLKRSGKLRWHDNYIVAQIVTAVLVLLLVLGRSSSALVITALPAYVISLFWMFRARAKFVRASAESELKNTNITEYAFGMDSVSLLVKRVTDTVSLPAGNERKACLDALIKINKAAQEHGEVNFGIVDTIKKTLITGLPPLVYWLGIHAESLKNASDGVSKSLASPWILYGWLTVVGLCAIYLLYDIMFGQPRLKKRKKRYLLVLNIIKETSAD